MQRNDSINKFNIGKEITDKGFASSSFDRGVSKYYAGKNGTILHIEAPKGTKGVYIRQNSAKPEEVEFLLSRNTKLVVYNIKGNNVYCKLKYL